jgi:hypothetical protein
MSLRLSVHADGSGEVFTTMPGEPQQHVADPEEAVALLRALWARAAAVAQGRG